MKHKLVVGIFRKGELRPDMYTPKVIYSSLPRAEILCMLLNEGEQGLPDRCYLTYDFAHCHKL